jgi:hypothetical protein
VAIPSFDAHGLLPAGVYDCSLADIKNAFAWNAHRAKLFAAFETCYLQDIRANFSEPLLFDGSYVTDKNLPDDIDVVLDLVNATNSVQIAALKYLTQRQKYLHTAFRVHFWINLPGVTADFRAFFQYVGTKTAKFKGLQPMHNKGILRLP